MVVFLLMQTGFPSSTDSVDSGNWVNFLECKKFCGIIFALSKDMLQCSENILIGHSCFSVKKVRIFLVFSKRERWTYYSVPYVPNVQSKCFQMFSFFEELEAPFQIWNPQSFWGGFLYSPALGNNFQNILCADSMRTYVSFFFGGGGEGLKASCSPVFQL